MPEESTEEKEKRLPKFMLIKRFQLGDDVSLVDKAANGETFLAIKSEDGAIEDDDDQVDDEDAEEDEEVLEEDKAVWTAAAKTHGVGGAVTKQDGGSMDEKGMLRKMFDMLSAFFGGGGKGEEPKAKPEESKGKKKLVFLPMKPEAKKSEVVTNLKDEQGKEGEEKDEPDTEMVELGATIVAMKADIAARDAQIKVLTEKVESAEKSAKRTRIEAKVDGWIASGKAIPAMRNLLIGVFADEDEIVVEKSADGKEIKLTREAALEELIEKGRPAFTLGEATKAAEADFGKFGGMNAHDYAKQQLELSGKLPAGGDGKK